MQCPNRHFIGWRGTNGTAVEDIRTKSLSLFVCCVTQNQPLVSIVFRPFPHEIRTRQMKPVVPACDRTIRPQRLRVAVVVRFGEVEDVMIASVTSFLILSLPCRIRFG